MPPRNDNEDPTGGYTPLGPGTTVAHYEIVDKLGSGGMGDVYLATDTKLNRRVALKFLAGHIVDDPTLRARFTREVQAVASLNHPNIVHVYEVSDYEGRPYFTMEFVEGQTLRHARREQEFTWDELLRVACGICEGLAAAHRIGIVHRDVKPANILIDQDGRVRILDFGLAKRAIDSDLTTIGSTLGTIAYMSPEQVRGQQSDRRSDLFSLGIVIYEMVTGRLPFKGDYDAATMQAIVNDQPDPIAKHRTDAPKELQPIIDRLLAKELEQRYQDATQLLADLTGLRDRLRFASDSRRATPGRKRKVGAIALAAVAVLVVAGAVVGVLSRRSKTSSESAGRVSTETTPVDLSASNATQSPGEIAPGVDRTPPDQGVSQLRESLANVQAEVAARQTQEQQTAEQIRHLRDSLERLKTAPPTTQEPPVVANASPHEATPSDQAEAARRNEGSPPAAATETYSAAARAASAIDSLDATATVATFWRALGKGDMDELKRLYPKMPRQSETLWRTFIDNTKEMNAESTVESLTLSDGEAKGRVSVRMDFRDAAGRHTQDVRYDLRLAKSGGQWVIVQMEQKR